MIYNLLYCIVESLYYCVTVECVARRAQQPSWHAHLKETNPFSQHLFGGAEAAVENTHTHTKTILNNIAVDLVDVDRLGLKV